MYVCMRVAVVVTSRLDKQSRVCIGPTSAAFLLCVSVQTLGGSGINTREFMESIPPPHIAIKNLTGIP